MEENSRLYKNATTYTDDGKSMDWSLCKMRKATPNKILQEQLNTTTTQGFTPTKKEEKVGYAVVIDQQSTRRRIRDQSSIFSTKKEAIIDAIPKTGVRGVIFTDSLSTMMAASKRLWINEKEM
jgi:hypothetical protein